MEESRFFKLTKTELFTIGAALNEYSRNMSPTSWLYNDCMKLLHDIRVAIEEQETLDIRSGIAELERFS